MPSTRTSQNCLPGTRMNNLDYGTVSSKICLERFVEVGASRRRLPGAGPMDVNELGIAREQPFERDVVDYGRARPIAFGIRMHWREGILDLLCDTVLVVGVAVFFCALYLFGAGAGMDVRQVHRPRTG